MNTRAVSQAADVICRAMENGKRTPAGWAMALESAGLLMSPEWAADVAATSAGAVATAEYAVAELKREHEESARLRAEVAALRAERHSTNEALVDVTVALRAVEILPSQGVTLRPPVEDVTPQVQKLRELLAGQREALEGEHYASVHHTYLTPRDLPELGGAG